MSVLLASEEKPTATCPTDALSPSSALRSQLRVPSRFERKCRDLLLAKVPALREGSLTISDAEGIHGEPDQSSGAIALTVCNPRVYPRMIFGGSLSAAESYLLGDWNCRDLVAAMRILCRQTDQLRQLDFRSGSVFKPLRRAWHALRRNSRQGSRRNIAEHYDLGNDFFALMLDSTMTYSSGLFESPETTLEQASFAKYDRICQKLQLQPTDRVIEIGCGWGGFAIHAARECGCHVTATTISQEQYAFARQRVDRYGLSDRIDIINRDYRDLDGTYDKLVSIEMIEAVGEKYLDSYFGQCSRLLVPHGTMMLQAITIPDFRYDHYRRSVDFIQRYIFPGGFLPSLGVISRTLGRVTDLRIEQQQDFAEDYAMTLAAWRDLFWQNEKQIRALGFDDRFMRMWHYYLCYCEAGFRERQIGLSQMLMAKPSARLSSK